MILGALPQGRAPSILHTAPEKTSISPRLRSLGGTNYVSVDIEPRRADRVADLCALPFEYGSFDLVWSSHVLEHVVDADKAISEIARVMRAGALALLEVPICSPDLATTVRNAERDVHGHMWRPGRDWLDRYPPLGLEIVGRFTEADFPAEAYPPTNLLIALCRKVST